MSRESTRRVESPFGVSETFLVGDENAFGNMAGQAVPFNFILHSQPRLLLY